MITARRLTASVTAFLLIVVGGWLAATPAHAAESTVGDFVVSYEPGAPGAGAEITGYNGAGGSVSIPAAVSIDETDYPITSIGSGAFRDSQISDLALGSGVTTVGQSAFESNALTQLTIPDQVTSLRAFAFRDNLISDLTLGGGVTEVGQSAFESNALTQLTIPEQVTALHSSAFRNNQISGLTLGGGVTTIGQSAFEGNLLAQLTIPEQVTTLQAFAFRNNLISDLTLGSGITEVGQSAFESNALTQLTIPDQVTSLQAFAFRDNLISGLTLGGGVTTIGQSAFEGNLLAQLTIPDQVATLQAFAFRDNLISDLTLGSGVTTIGGAAFESNALSQLAIPDQITTLEFSAFEDNPTLVEVVFDGAPPNVWPTGPGETFDTGSGSLLLHYLPQYDVTAFTDGFTYPEWQGYSTKIIGADVPPSLDGPATATAQVGVDGVVWAPTVLAGVPAPTVTATGLPAGLSIDAATGTISGTPTAPGTAEVTITADNGVDPTAVQALAITVAPADVSPSLDGPATATAQVGVDGVVWAPTVLAGVPAPTVTATGLPAGLSIDAATGTIAGTPIAAASTYTVEVAADNGIAAAATHRMTLTVTPGSIAAIFIEISDPTPDFGTMITASASASDAAGNDLGDVTADVTFSSSDGSDTVTGSQITFGSTGPRSLSALHHGADIAADAVVVDVQSVAPAIDGPSTISLNVGEEGSWTPSTLTGAPRPTVTASGLPGGLTVDGPTGVISGIVHDDAGSYAVMISASNGVGHDAVLEVTITVEAGAVAELFVAASDAAPMRGETISLTVTAEDAAGNDLGDVTDAVVFTSDVDSDVIDGNRVTFPSASPHAITATHTETRTEATITIDVQASAPTLTGATVWTVTVGEATTWTPSSLAGVPTVAVAAEGLPDGLGIDAATGVITGTVSDAADEYEVTLTASNGVDPDAVLELTITVEAGVVAELLLDASDTAPNQGEAITLTVAGVDAAGNDLGDITDEVIFTSDIDSDVIDGNQVTFPTASPHAITATHAETLAEATITIDVQASAPTLSGPTAWTVTVGEEATWTPSALAGVPTAAVAAHGLPDGLAIDAVTGVITGTVQDTAGDHVVTLIASNGVEPDAVLELKITVEAGAVAELFLDASDTVPGQGETITLTVTGADAAGNDLGDVTDEVVFTSDVGSDVIDGNRVTFPSVSTHTITATHSETLTRATMAVEVTAADAGGAGDGDGQGGDDADEGSGTDGVPSGSELPVTGGASSVAVLLAALVALLIGFLLVFRARALENEA